MISSESYNGSSKTVTLIFDEVGTTYYDIKIKVTSSYSVTFGVYGTVKESNTTNTTENEAWGKNQAFSLFKNAGIHDKIKLEW